MKRRTPALSQTVLFSAVAAAVSTMAAPARSLAAVFASQAISYTPGSLSIYSQPYEDANGAVGAPDPMTGNDYSFPNVLSPFSPAYDTNSAVTPYKSPQLAIVGEGGTLTLQFPIPVKVSASAPSIGVISNAGLDDSNYPLAQNFDPAMGFSGGSSRVEVSKDGINWVKISDNYTFSNPANYFTDSGPYDSVPGTQVADFGKPFTGTLSSFNGKDWPGTLATLNGSAGGTWIDLSSTGLDEVRYIRFTIDPAADPKNDPQQQLPIDAVMLNDSLNDYSQITPGNTLNLSLGTISLSPANTTGGVMLNTGTLALSGGTINSASPFVFNAGTMSWTSGTFAAPLTNVGTVIADPGAGQTLNLSSSVFIGGSFGSISSNAGTIDVESGTLLGSAGIFIGAGATLHKTGGGLLVMGGAQSHGTGASLSLDNGTVQFTSSPGSNLHVQLSPAGALTFASGSYSIGGFQGGGSVSIPASVSVAISSTSSAGTLAMDSISTLDLTNAGIVILDTTSLGAVKSLITHAADVSAGVSHWDMPGITSSTAAADHSHAVGYALASTLPNGGSTSFNGITFSDAVIARYTLVGDTGLKGSVDLSDYTKVVLNLGKSNASWSDGNFDYSGNVNLGDYTAVIKNLGRSDGQSTVFNATGPSAQQVKASALTLHTAPAVTQATTATDVTLMVNPTNGRVTLVNALQTGQAVITAYTINSPSQSLLPFSADGGGKYLANALENNPSVFYKASNGLTYNLWTGIKNVSTFIGEGFSNHYNANVDSTWTNYTLATSGYALGTLFKRLSSGGTRDLVFQWEDANLNTYTSVVNYVNIPEPASLSLLAFGGTLLLSRRRNRNTRARRLLSEMGTQLFYSGR